MKAPVPSRAAGGLVAALLLAVAALLVSIPATATATATAQPGTTTLGQVAPLLVVAAALAGLVLVLVRRHDYSRSAADE